MNAALQLDDLDQKLITLLCDDARVSNRKIAADLGVTEGTVRGRIRRLQHDGMIAFTAVTGFEMARKSRLAFISIQAAPQQLRRVADEIADIKDVNAVLTCLGKFNIIAICLFDELEDLVSIASDRILTIPDVFHIETAIAVHTTKYNAKIARITPQKINDR